MEIVYFVLLLVLTGFFVWLLHKQQTMAIEKLSAQQMLTLQRLTALQDTLNNTHALYQQELSTVRSTAEASFTQLAQVNADTIKETTVRDKLFAQFADQIKIECAKAVGDAAADALGLVKERMDRAVLEHKEGAAKV